MTTPKTTPRKTLGTLLLTLSFVGVAALAAGTPVNLALGFAGADCKGDPCANTQCTEGEASGHAVGSEHAWAEAHVGANENKNDQPGTAHAVATGKGDVSASAKGKEDWSWDEANASCSTPEGGADVGAFLRLLDDGPVKHGIAIGCLADSRITSAQTFSGRLFVTPAGGAVVYDAARGLGLAFETLDLSIDGTTLAGVAPIDVTGLYPTPYAANYGVAGDGESSECSADLVTA